MEERGGEGDLEIANDVNVEPAGPIGLYEMCESLSDKTLHAQRVVLVDFLQPSGFQEVLAQQGHIAHTLERCESSIEYRI